MTRVDTLRGQLATSLVRLTELQRRAERVSVRDHVLPRAFEELQRALAELEVAVEELREQNSRLELARVEADAERSRWQALFDHAPLAYLLTDASAVIRSVNDAGADLLAITQRFLAGKPLVLFVDGGRDEFLGEVTRAVMSDRPTIISCALRPRERAPRQVSAEVHRFTLPDGSPGLWWIFR
jgi:PAS domain-containing protein